MYDFALYISGETARNMKIAADIRAFISAVYGDSYTLRIIDVIRHQHMASADGILATPTLVKVTPPMKRVLGNFSDMRKIFQGLGIPLPPDTSDETKP